MHRHFGLASVFVLLAVSSITACKSRGRSEMDTTRGGAAGGAVPGATMPSTPTDTMTSPVSPMSPSTTTPGAIPAPAPGGRMDTGMPGAKPSTTDTAMKKKNGSKAP